MFRKSTNRALFCAATLTTIGSLTWPVAWAQSVREAIDPPGATTIAPYSPAIQYKGGLLFVSGNIAYVDGAIPPYAVDGEDDVQDQTRIIMDSIQSIMNTAGYSLDDALKVSVFMTDMAFYGPFNEVYGTYWGKEIRPPAREAVQVAGLPGAKPGAPVLLEVSVIAGK